MKINEEKIANVLEHMKNDSSDDSLSGDLSGDTINAFRGLNPVEMYMLVNGLNERLITLNNQLAVLTLILQDAAHPGAKK
jgi:hypothetical protein